MPRILITGENSFIGRNFREYSKFSEITEVSLLNSKPEDLDFQGYDVILHLAAIVHRSNKIHESEYSRINRDLCLEVAKNAKEKGTNHFIFLSSSTVYGSRTGKNVFNEDSKCNPDDPYGKSKYEAELLLKELNDPGFTVSIIRTPIVYGDGVKANMLSIIKLIDTFPVLPFKGVNNLRSYTFVENLVHMIDCIIEKRLSGTFIAMDEKPISTTELVRYISKYLGRNILVFKLPEFVIRLAASLFPKKMNGLFGSVVLDNSETRKKLGFDPPVTTEEGIKKMVAYYKRIKSAGD